MFALDRKALSYDNGRLSGGSFGRGGQEKANGLLLKVWVESLASQVRPSCFAFPFLPPVYGRAASEAAIFVVIKTKVSVLKMEE